MLVTLLKKSHQSHLYYCAIHCYSIVPLTLMLSCHSLLHYRATHTYIKLCHSLLYYCATHSYTIAPLTLTLSCHSHLNHRATHSYTIMPLTLKLSYHSLLHYCVTHSYTTVPLTLTLSCQLVLHYHTTHSFTIVPFTLSYSASHLCVIGEFSFTELCESFLYYCTSQSIYTIVPVTLILMCQSLLS